MSQVARASQRRSPCPMLAAPLVGRCRSKCDCTFGLCMFWVIEGPMTAGLIRVDSGRFSRGGRRRAVARGTHAICLAWEALLMCCWQVRAAKRHLTAPEVVAHAGGHTRKRAKKLEKSTYNSVFAIRLCVDSHDKEVGRGKLKSKDVFDPGRKCYTCRLAGHAGPRAQWYCRVCEVPLCDTCYPLWHKCHNFIEARQAA